MKERYKHAVNIIPIVHDEVHQLIFPMYLNFLSYVMMTKIKAKFASISPTDIAINAMNRISNAAYPNSS